MLDYMQLANKSTQTHLGEGLNHAMAMQAVSAASNMHQGDTQRHLDQPSQAALHPAHKKEGQRQQGKGSEGQGYKEAGRGGAPRDQC